MTTPSASILLVEDEGRLMTSCQMLLESAGYRVVPAPGGKEAIRLLRSERYDLMLLDLNMPEVTGLDVLAFVNENDIAIRTIVVSGETGFRWVSQSFKQGAWDFVQKPYEFEVLLNTVRNALRETNLERDNQSLVRQLAQSEKLHRFMIESSPDIIFIVNKQGQIAFVNERVRSLLGYEKSELIGEHYALIVAPESLEKAAHCFIERRGSERSAQDEEIWLRTREGYNGKYGDACRVAIELSAVGVYEPDEDGSDHWLKSFAGSYVVARDITEKLEAQRTIQYQAYHDLLTGLPNRSLFMDRLKVAIRNARREERKLAIMFLDLDRFKHVNDTLGHGAGDELLKEVSERLVSVLRESDTLARIGGDEFMVLLPNATTEDMARNVARKIVDVVKEPVHLDGHDVFVTASIGISMFPSDGETAETLIKNSDIAMYHTKDQGKDGYHLYLESMSARHHRMLSVESDIRKGMLEGQFEVYYQPQICTRENRIVGVEALLRWNHPERGLLTPAYFLGVAEETGIIIELGEWVMATAIEEVKSWLAIGVEISKLAVNVTSRQIEQMNFVDRLIALLKQHHFPGEMLEVEITESTLMHDIENTVSKLRQLSNYGIGVAIDDFGTGYSSLSLLQKLPINRLKIDRSFIQDITDESDRSIIEAIAHMAKGMKLDMVAEGVEEEYQLNYLKQLECPIVQGYFYSQGLPADRLRMMLGRNASAGAA